VLIAAVAWWWVQYKSNPSRFAAGADVERVLARGEIVGEIPTGTAESMRPHQHRSPWGSGNDAEVATRGFKAANDCLLYHSARNELNSILGDERLVDLSSETPATLKDLDATTSRYLAIVRETERYCIGSNREELAQAYSDAIFEAALSGSPDAESCFVTSNVSPLEIPGAIEYRRLEDRYIEYAPIFTENALERFDPYVAERVLYRYTASPGSHPSRLDHMPKPDPYLTWQMARLASLRALPEQRARIEKMLVQFEEQHSLEAGQIDRADAWAQAVYEREFSARPPVDLDRQVPCYSTPSLAP